MRFLATWKERFGETDGLPLGHMLTHNNSQQTTRQLRPFGMFVLCVCVCGGGGVCEGRGRESVCVYVCFLSGSMEICDIIFAWWMMSSKNSVDANLHVAEGKKKKKKLVMVISLLGLLFHRVSSEQAKMCVYG